MERISHWAMHHRKQAIAGLIAVEIIRGTLGMTFGRYALPALAPDLISWVSLFLAAAVLTIQERYYRTASTLSTEARIRLKRRSMMGIIGCVFALSVLAGNGCQTFFQDTKSYTTAPVYSARMLSDSIPDPSSQLRRKAQLEKEITYYEKSNTDQENSPKRLKLGWKIVLYGIGFVAAGILTGLGFALSCRLACNGYGFLSFLTFLGAITVPSGLLLVLAHFLRKPPRRVKNMTPKDRSNEVLAFVLGPPIAFLILLLASAFSR